MKQLQITKKARHKTAFITGAAGGLGFAFCKHLAADGWTIGMVDMDKDHLKSACDAIEMEGGKPISFVLDITDRRAYQKSIQQFLAETPGIDLLINNAGVGDGDFFENYNLENWDWMIDINVKAVIAGTHFFAKQFLAQGHGMIINIASAAGFVNAPTMSAYNLSKAAVISLSETLSYEWANKGVQVTVLTPTFFPTQIMSKARGNEKMKQFAQIMMDRSKTNAHEVAFETLQQAAKGKHQVIFPKDAKIRYFLKRFFPGILRKQILKIVTKSKSHAN